MTATLESPTLWQARPGWGISVDLTPPEIIAGRRVRGLKRRIGVALVVVLVLCVGASLDTLHHQSQAQAAYDTEQDHTTALQSDATKYADITSIQQALAQIGAEVAGVMATDVDFVNLMARIRFSLPAQVTITDESVSLAPATAAAPTVPATTTDPTGGDPTGTTTTPTTGGAVVPTVIPAVIGVVTLAGSAPTIGDVASLVTVLGGLVGITDVVPTSTTRTKTGLDYTISLDLTDDVLTHRFDPAAPK